MENSEISKLYEILVTSNWGKIHMLLYGEVLIFYTFWAFSWFFISFIPYIHYPFSESSYKNSKILTKTTSCFDNLRYLFWFLWYNKHLATFRNLRKPVLIILKITNEKLSPILSPSKGGYPACKSLFKVRKITWGWRTANFLLLLLNIFLLAW